MTKNNHGSESDKLMDDLMSNKIPPDEKVLEWARDILEEKSDGVVIVGKVYNVNSTLSGLHLRSKSNHLPRKQFLESITEGLEFTMEDVAIIYKLIKGKK